MVHPRSSIRPHWSQKDAKATEDLHPQPVFRGRRLSTMMIGKMPGRQIVLYDKRNAAIQKRELHWFDAWALSRDEPELEVIRVELRAGKNELRRRWQIKTFQDVADSIGDVFLCLVSNIRYLAPHQSDSNTTRQTIDPVWQLVTDHVEGGLTHLRSGITPDQVRSVDREEAKNTYETLVLGNLVSLAIVEGVSSDNLLYQLPALAEQLCRRTASENRDKISKAAARAEERLHFLCPSS